MLRRGRPGEARALQEFVQEAFEQYREFAPAGWEPPDQIAHVDEVAKRLANPACWSVVAEEESAIVGYTLWEPVEGLAHVRALFIAPRRWGTGLARQLLQQGTAQMARRGWTTGRLFTPAPHARARRFYEREGWAMHAEPYFEEKLGLDMVEYRRSL